MSDEPAKYWVDAARSEAFPDGFKARMKKINDGDITFQGTHINDMDREALVDTIKHLSGKLCLSLKLALDEEDKKIKGRRCGFMGFLKDGA